MSGAAFDFALGFDGGACGCSPWDARYAASALRVRSLQRPSILPGLKFARSRKTWRRAAASTSALLGVRARVAFLFADAGAILPEINRATSARRKTAFTQMDRSTRQRRLSWATHVQESRPALRFIAAAIAVHQTRLLFARRQKKARRRRTRLNFSLRPGLRDQPSRCRRSRYNGLGQEHLP